MAQVVRWVISELQYLTDALITSVIYKFDDFKINLVV